MWKSENK